MGGQRRRARRPAQQLEGLVWTRPTWARPTSTSVRRTWNGTEVYHVPRQPSIRRRSADALLQAANDPQVLDQLPAENSTGKQPRRTRLPDEKQLRQLGRS